LEGVETPSPALPARGREMDAKDSLMKLVAAGKAA